MDIRCCIFRRSEPYFGLVRRIAHDGEHVVERRKSTGFDGCELCGRGLVWDTLLATAGLSSESHIYFPSTVDDRCAQIFRRTIALMYA